MRSRRGGARWCGLLPLRRHRQFDRRGNAEAGHGTAQPPFRSASTPPATTRWTYARIAARHFGTEHHEHYVTPAELVAAIPTGRRLTTTSRSATPRRCRPSSARRWRASTAYTSCSPATAATNCSAATRAMPSRRSSKRGGCCPQPCAPRVAAVLANRLTRSAPAIEQGRELRRSGQRADAGAHGDLQPAEALWSRQ